MSRDGEVVWYKLLLLGLGGDPTDAGKLGRGGAEDSVFVSVSVSVSGRPSPSSGSSRSVNSIHPQSNKENPIALELDPHPIQTNKSAGMQHRRKPASSAAPSAAKTPPSRRPTAPLSLAGLLVAVFLVATFLYNEDVTKSTSADVAVAGSVATSRSPELSRRQQQEEAQEEAQEGGDHQEKDHQQQQPPPPPEQPPPQRAAACDLYQGRWTFDAAGELSPLYRESECEFLTEQVTCMRNGRRDDSYQKWRWQPAGCDLPRYPARPAFPSLPPPLIH
nr:unnamed protein product [Digitaria exilis]